MNSKSAFGVGSLLLFLGMGALIFYDGRWVLPIWGSLVGMSIAWSSLGLTLFMVKSVLFYRTPTGALRPTSIAIIVIAGWIVACIVLMASSQFSFTLILTSTVATLFYAEWSVGICGRAYCDLIKPLDIGLR